MGAIAETLAGFAVEMEAAAIPASVRERAVLHLADALGCGIAAVGLGAVPQASELAWKQGGRGEASLIGPGPKVPAAQAALANGTRCHALDFDDTHEEGICHSSVVVGPAALAAAEATAASGEELVTAYVLGSEVALRIAVAIADELYQRGFHPTSVCGAFGAAAAAARLFGADSAAAANALGIVGSFAAGLFEYLSDGSATKPLHAGWAAQAGIQAARLAAAGATGPATVIEGRFGLLASHAERAADEARKIVAGLGERWEFEGLAVKLYPACHFAHASTWAAGALADEHGLAPADIERIVVRVPAEGARLVLEPLAEKRTPKTPYDAKFSLPYTAAHRIVRGSLGLAAFTEAAIADPDVLALAARVDAEPLGAEAAEASRFCGGARLRTTDGRELDRFLAAPPGSPAMPVGPEEVWAKFRANVGLALPEASAEHLAAALAGIDAARRLDPIVAGLAWARPGTRGARSAGRLA
ncbi:MAG TPA: MmgE/PrpD family protein [Solirubrobacterales bacterium]